MTEDSSTMWDTIVFSAKINNCSCSRLAINGGLNSTTFNKCKWKTNYGQHWLSFGSILKVMHGAQMNILDFSVIYQILYIFPKFEDTQQMQEIMHDMNNHMRQHIANIRETQNWT